MVTKLDYKNMLLNQLETLNTEYNLGLRGEIHLITSGIKSGSMSHTEVLNLTISALEDYGLDSNLMTFINYKRLVKLRKI